jgi:hypothetical protein
MHILPAMFPTLTRSADVNDPTSRPGV